MRSFRQDETTANCGPYSFKLWLKCCNLIALYEGLINEVFLNVLKRFL